jgi:hypothetical protein
MSLLNFTIDFLKRLLMLDAYFLRTWKDCILKLMDTVAAIVGALNDPALLQSIINHTARQHARLGVSASQYDAFGAVATWRDER